MKTIQENYYDTLILTNPGRMKLQVCVSAASEEQQRAEHSELRLDFDTDSKINVRV